MPIPATKKQLRWAFPAEDRGELECGTARRWARETRAYHRKKRKTKGKRSYHRKSKR